VLAMGPSQHSCGGADPEKDPRKNAIRIYTRARTKRQHLHAVQPGSSRFPYRRLSTSRGGKREAS
jgi:hypothetical protein